LARIAALQVKLNTAARAVVQTLAGPKLLAGRKT
jgi:hypothetical protein